MIKHANSLSVILFDAVRIKIRSSIAVLSSVTQLKSNIVPSPPEATLTIPEASVVNTVEGSGVFAPIPAGHLPIASVITIGSEHATGAVSESQGSEQPSTMTVKTNVVVSTGSPSSVAVIVIVFVPLLHARPSIDNATLAAAPSVSTTVIPHTPLRSVETSTN